jgi:ornithine decarboxylase
MMNSAFPADHRWATAGEVFDCAGAVVGNLRPIEPAYLFSERCLARQARRFLTGFPGAVSYAVKANPEARVIRTLASCGIRHFDVASAGEVEAIATLCPAATLHFNNPIKPVEAIETAYRRYGVRSFALDEEAELKKIYGATDGDREIIYSVRFRLEHAGASYDFGSKFGTSPENAARLLRRIQGLGARPALTFHPGSQCTDPGMYTRYLEVAARIAAQAGVQLAQINVGGGFPEYYDNTRAPDLGAYFLAVKEVLTRLFPEPPRLMCEPGRAMVASAVSLLTRVIHVRDDGCTVFLNDGVYGGMQEQSIVDLRFPVRVWRDGRMLGGERVTWHVFGPTCDPVDRLSRDIALPDSLRSGDYVEFGLLGAYGSATATAFNGFRSAAYVSVARGFRPTPVAV